MMQVVKKLISSYVLIMDTILASRGNSDLRRNKFTPIALSSLVSTIRKLIIVWFYRHMISIGAIEDVLTLLTKPHT